MRDNLFQVASIVIGVLLGAFVAVVYLEDSTVIAIAGGFIGMVVGSFNSGFVLMVYRLTCHMHGKHK